MPVTGDKKTTSTSKDGVRTIFRPPWVKENTDTATSDASSTSSATASAKSTDTPWGKRTTPLKTDTNKTNAKENGQTKDSGVVKKESKLQSREIKVPVMTEKKTTQLPLKSKEKINTAPKIPDEEEIEAEIEKKEKEFKLEKPKLRPVKRNKSMISDKQNEKDNNDGGNDEDENDDDETNNNERKGRFKLEKPKLRHVVVNQDKQLNKPEEIEPKIRPVLKKTPKVDEFAKPTQQEPVPEFKGKVLKKIASREHLRRESSVNVPAPPPLPSSTPRPPPPPPPPELAAPPGFEKKPITNDAKEKLEKLKMRARRRPDWSEMMQEVERGIKLKHVECNDRSKPIISTKSMTKVGEQFVFETEKANVHNQLLKQIQFGIKLKPTVCNDRSKPILEGLRKFRRQMTIEEQIQRSESRASALNEPPPDEESEDEMDDIDKLRDDLQSTKQLLQIELRNKETQERENKRLLAKIANLEAELEREKQRTSGGESRINSLTGADEALVRSLRKDAEQARKTANELEEKYHQVADQYDDAKEQIEKQKNQIAQLERKLSQALQGTLPSLGSRRASEAAQKESSPEFDIEISESESEEDEEKKAAKAAKRLSREVKMLRLKLNKLKDKQTAAKKERSNLKEIMKKNQAILKEENKKFKKLEKEVEKMAKLMRADEEEEEEEEEEEGEEEEVEDETETDESESETEETVTDSESDSEPEDASDEAKKNNLDPRVKRHEGRLSALKKGNLLLQANADRLQDEINKIRDKAVSLQAELDSVLSELG